MSRRSLSSGVAVIAAAMVLAGCQSVNQAAVEAEPFACPPGTEGCDEIRPIGPGGELVVTMGDFYFDIEEGVAVDGPIDVRVINEGNALHNFRIDAAAGEVKKVEAGPGEEAEGTLELFGGTEYVYYCDVPGHRSQGMEGFLTVYIDEETARQEGELGEDDAEDDNVGDDPTDIPAEDAGPEPGEGAQTEAGPGNTIAPTEPEDDGTEG